MHLDADSSYLLQLILLKLSGKSSQGRQSRSLYNKSKNSKEESPTKPSSSSSGPDVGEDNKIVKSNIFGKKPHKHKKICSLF